MKRRRLGLIDLEVSPVGLGCWQFSQGKGLTGKFWGVLEEDEIERIVQTSLDAGVTWFDTAEAYGWGRSEAALAAALRNAGVRPGSVVVATKWFPVLRFAGSITRTIEARVQHLGEYPIDLHQIHNPFSFSGIPAQIRRMAELAESGRIRAVGVSNFNAEQMERAHRELHKQGLVLASNQVQYNLLDRRIEGNGILDTAKRLGTSIIAYSPLAQGILTGKYHADPEAIRRRSGPRRFMPAFRPKGLARTQPLVNALNDMAASYSVTAAQVALNWLVTSHGETVLAIPGASSPKHARENAEAVTFELESGDIRRLDELSKQVVVE
jgi:aryl-alcohol dehydrogenase-like predicted oxidoreductase